MCGNVSFSPKTHPSVSCLPILYIVCHIVLVVIIIPLLPLTLYHMSHEYNAKQYTHNTVYNSQFTVGNVDIFLILRHRNVIKVKINVTNTDGAIKNRQSRETGNIGYIRHKG